MSNDYSITRFESWTLNIRPGTGKNIILLIHGWTGDENSMSVFSRNIPVNYWIIAPRAPFTARDKGYSWRAPAPHGSWPSVELFRPSIDGLLELIEHWSAIHELSSTRFDVAGFSQGGALAMTFGVLHPDRVRKLGILAGFAPEGVESLIKPELLSEVSVFMAHGTQDKLVPLPMAKRARALLESAGAQVEYCESEVGHKLSVDCLRSFERFLQY